MWYCGFVILWYSTFPCHHHHHHHNHHHDHHPDHHHDHYLDHHHDHHNQIRLGNLTTGGIYSVRVAGASESIYNPATVYQVSLYTLENNKNNTKKNAK